MTAQISAALVDFVGARGVAVMVEAEHLCMAMRGVQKVGASTMTSHFTGVFDKDESWRQRFLDAVRLRAGA